MTCPAVINNIVYMELDSDALTNISIKLPEFGDTHSAHTSIIKQADLYIRRNITYDKLKMSFEAIIDKTDIIAFYNASRGKLVKLTDQYDNVWLGFLINRRLSVKTFFEHTTCNDYGFDIEFDGKRITDGELN